jgi:hypothetical protein
MANVDWGKHSAIGTYIAVVLTVVTIAVTVWLGLHTPGQSVKGEHPWVPWAIVAVVFLIGGVITASIFLRAAKIARESGGHRDVFVSDAVADFSITSNPSGNWAYGWRRNRFSGEFALHTQHIVNAAFDLETWQTPEISHMCVGRNRRGRVIRGNPGTYTVPPDVLLMHPGEGGIYDVVRWTCPQSGKYSIKGRFIGLDFDIDVADSDVDIVTKTDTSLLTSPSRVLQGAGSHIPFELTDISLEVGEMVDFVVGVGPSGSHGSDSRSFVENRISVSSSVSEATRRDEYAMPPAHQSPQGLWDKQDRLQGDKRSASRAPQP